MNELRKKEREDYYKAAGTWAHDRQASAERSRKIAWIVAGFSTLVALVEAFALVALIPLKREVPYTLLVDRQTGYVEALKPLERRTITPDAALTRSFLVQYVIAREGFDAESLQENYRKVGLWSADDAKQRYINLMRVGNPLSPLANLPKAARIDVRVRSVSSLRSNQALVRFDTVRSDRGSSSEYIENWAAVVNYRFSDAAMSAEDRLINPLGFQVVRYRKNPETLPLVAGMREAASVPNPQPTEVTP